MTLINGFCFGEWIFFLLWVIQRRYRIRSDEKFEYMLLFHSCHRLQMISICFPVSFSRQSKRFWHLDFLWNFIIPTHINGISLDIIFVWFFFTPTRIYAKSRQQIYSLIIASMSILFNPLKIKRTQFNLSVMMEWL